MKGNLAPEGGDGVERRGVGEGLDLRAVVLAAFGQRRKSLANSIAAGLNMSAERARALCASARVDPGRRAETLSMEEFARLAMTTGE